MKMSAAVVVSTVWAVGLAVPAQAAPAPPGRSPAVSAAPGGLVVQIGWDASQPVEAAGLPAAGNALRQILEADPEDVDAARAAIRAAGAGGSISVLPWVDPSRLPYADNLVNVLIVRDAVSVGRAEILRVLRPAGVAIFTTSGGPGTPERIVKPWPAEMDDWSHWEHAADGNPVSRDALVGPPRELQWIDGPRYSKQHWGPRLGAAVTAAGRLFTVEDETPTSTFNIADRWVLIARDAFNGVVLWRRELPQWASGVWEPSRRNPAAQAAAEQNTWGLFSSGTGGRGPEAMQTMVAAGEHLFVPLAAGEPVAMLSAATGELVRTFTDAPAPKKVVFAEGVLLIGDERQVCALQPETGTLLWRAAGSHPAIWAGRAYLLSDRRQRLECRQLQSGELVWESDGNRAERPNAFDGTLQLGSGILLAPSSVARKSTWYAFDLEDGRPLWQMDYSAGPFASGGGPFLIRDQIWILHADQGTVQKLDPRTGRVASEVAAPAIRHVGHHARCCYSRATTRFIIAKERGADFVDLDSGEVSWNNWVRGPCRRGVIPANGLLYAGQHSCRCYSESAVRGLVALAPARGSSVAEDATIPHLHKGPAYAAAGDPPADDPSPADWPTYRHDAARSGGTPTALPEQIAARWSKRIGGRLTAPVVAQGLVFVAATDECTLYALDGDSGAVRWTYSAGARIDSPPTIAGGQALFGCRDGYLYCLRAEDGSLAWRFRVAPQERMIGAYGQLESAWPVSGSVLVRDGVAYAVAGQNSFLDGGLTVCGVDCRSGQLRYSRSLSGPWPGPEIGTSRDTPNRGFTMPGTSSDVLVAEADAIYLRELQLDPSLGAAEDLQPNFYPDPGGEGEGGGGDVKFWDNLPHAEKHAVMDDPAYLNRGFFYQFPGRRLYTTTGLLDGDWHRRMYWAYGQVVGQYIVFRGEMGYAVRVFEANSREGGFNSGEGYVLLAGRTAERALPGQQLYALPTDQSVWRVRLTLRPQAMALAGDHLVLAGPPDRSQPGESLAALDGRQGGVLELRSARDGRKAAVWQLPSPPVFDGLAIAGGRLYWSGMDGQLHCWAGTTR